MKKVLALLAVLAMTQVASGAIVDIWITSLNGEPINPTKEITIDKSDEINFDIWAYGMTEDQLFALNPLVVVDGPGELTFTEADLTDPEGMWEAAYNVYRRADAQKVEVGRANFTTGGPFLNPDGLLVLDHLLMHCTDYGDVFITLTNEGATGGGSMLITGAPVDGGPGVIVHQIPEPATVLLLGLGGLLLRRRK